MRLIKFIYLMTVSLSLSAQEYSGAINYGYDTYHVPDMPNLTLHTIQTGYQTRGWEFSGGVRQAGLIYASEQNSITGLPDHVISINATATKKIQFKKNLSMQVSLQPQVNWADGNAIHGYNIVPGGGLRFRLGLNEKDSSGVFIGAGYGTSFGSPRFIPVIGYEWKTKRFDIVAGFPEILASLSVKTQHIFSVWAKPTSIYTELSAKGHAAQATSESNKHSFEWVSISTGLSYTFKSEAGWKTFFSLGKPLYQATDLFGEKYKSTTSGLSQSFSVSAGFNYKLNF